MTAELTVIPPSTEPTPTARPLAGRHLFVFGAGFCAGLVALRAQAAGARVSATTRDPLRAAELIEQGIGMHLFDTAASGRRAGLAEMLEGVTDLLISIPPGEGGCPALAALTAAGALPSGLGWIGYLSSTGVYGDCGGAWIDETRSPAPQTADARARLIAERDWAALAAEQGAALDILRLSGLYGPGRRNALDRMRSPGIQAVLRHGQVFNRIHVEDAASAILAALSAPAGLRRLNLTDDLPAPAHALLDHAARLLGRPPAPRVPFDAAGLPPGAAAFWAENRRIRNDRLKALPGFALRYPTYREGLAAILADERASATTAAE
ncbi:NAD-dependent epimerase/dehydratase family protein [Rhodovulum sulfidophilum]|uniref:NAD-dependent epimerase/dehydratase family protein n=1 Tax=Rhodovulum sulfidophilum TaxID=35806 RepID=UPI0019224C6E|nr:NAD-dependent epimerase/dehydratase family protein [Rhodovulum sulfidophilum]MBL3575152.1 NAD-dependent epimerase/dehydratase family protein [Rhodovulum sulfidophilum]MCE8433303.1 NAD-dependent epimerase/dehydratase family protein [Rhodovulum sulfidophilum]MCF4115506.1 NAD-dependent epimerase/dehydratase family protein [Rhodovulum sulfidophilum]